jgi:DME family drug/metabolite transporter
VLSPWLLKESITKKDVGFMAVIAVGLGLFFIGVDQPVVSAPDPARGNIIALFGGFFWALTVCGLRWMGSAGEACGSAVAAVVIGNFIAFLVALPMALPFGAHGPGDWGLILYLGVFQIAVAYLFVTAALRSTSAFEASLILLIEPALNPVWAWIFQGERPGVWALAGGAMILGATTVKAMVDARTTGLREEVGA